MERPKKKIEYKNYIESKDEIEHDNGYNKACCEWEEFLPSNGELHNIITKKVGSKLLFSERHFLAEAIGKRLREKNNG